MTLNNMGEKISLSTLPSLKENLKGMLDAGNELLVSLEKAKSMPHVLDDATVAHMERVYSEQQGEINLYQTLHAQWLKEEQSLQQRENLEEFVSLINAVSSLNKQIFFLIDFFKKHTIDQILIKDPAELALDLLTGKIFPPDGLKI